MRVTLASDAEDRREAAADVIWTLGLMKSAMIVALRD